MREGLMLVWSLSGKISMVVCHTSLLSRFRRHVHTASEPLHLKYCCWQQLSLSIGNQKHRHFQCDFIKESGSIHTILLMYHAYSVWLGVSRIVDSALWSRGPTWASSLDSPVRSSRIDCA